MVITMYKSSIVLCKVHKSLQVKFEMILEDDPVTVAQNKSHGWMNEPVIKRFRYNNNQYFRIYPRPFLTLDISSKEDKKEGWNSAYQISLNQRALFVLKKNLEKLIEEFQTNKDLFYTYDTGEIVVDQELAEELRKVVPTKSKIIILQPCVVQDEDNNEIYYEGCIMAFNRLEYSTNLTFEEMGFLLDLLMQINLTELSMQLLVLEKLCPGEGHEIRMRNPQPERPPEPLHERPFVTKMEPSRIPEI